MDTSILYREVGALIRHRRRALDLTQVALAGRLGMSRGGLANIETGRQNLLVHQLYQFAAALEMSAHDLLPLPGRLIVDGLSPAARKSIDQYQATELPMPKGLTADQRAQVARVFDSSPTRRTTTTEGE